MALGEAAGLQGCREALSQGAHRAWVVQEDARAKKQ